MNKSNFYEVIVGTYEEFVLGYKFNVESEELVQSFASHSHQRSVRCLTFSDYYLASGGSDDCVVVYDLRYRKEHCILDHHNGTVTALDFTPDHTHIVSGSSDGVLAITRVGNWQVEKLFDGAHMGNAIHSIAVHKSGKIALSVGGDMTLRTWNLIKGRLAYAVNLRSRYSDARVLQGIKWSPNESSFVLFGGNVSDIWSIDSGGVVTKIEHKNKVSSCAFFNDESLAVGFESGDLEIFDKDGKKVKSVKAHSVRVKDIDIKDGYLATCSSDGEIKMWDIDLDVLASCNAGCRPTCIKLVPPIEVKLEKSDDQIEVIQSPEVKKNETVKRARVRIEVEGEEEEPSIVKRKQEKVLVQTEKVKKLKKKKKSIAKNDD